MRELGFALIFGWVVEDVALPFRVIDGRLERFRVARNARFRGRGRCETPKGLMVRRRRRAKAQPSSPTATTRHQAAHLRGSHRSARSW